ncbi:lysine decarboxylase domain-containing protein [Trypanosoma theileri]|uniref:Lysine decarboxylase domain-containing protein n=1 Tax=Trypanosoma theileri TaxID=67003 RepID=A0A1X0NU32_9TRYP|nr:lysine decarboxylase domain-containing protein [Trypanosoma theileri]ORC88048.1 lysine decarboxylase domain-containing protein [Trypanosoma theileri]
MSVEDAKDTTISPYVQKTDDLFGDNFTPTVKSYNNTQFLQSPQGRLVRILCEFEEPAVRLRQHHIRSTVLVFGSARAMTVEEHACALRRHEKRLAEATTPEAKKKCEDELRRLRSTQWMCEWMDTVYDISRKVAMFAIQEKKLINESFTHIPDYFRQAPSNLNKTLSTELMEELKDFVITTGGGPGFMEAANKGAASVIGANTMGMGISLPFEKGLNPYVTNDLAFEFHYFFTRKFWMMYSCRAIIVAPGGFGTLDEMFELLTLRQTKKIPELPIVLLCRKFWTTVINWQALVEFGTVSKEEVDSMCFADTAEEAMDFIKNFFEIKVGSPTS